MKVEYDTQPQKFLAKCDEHIANRLLDKLDALENDPVPQNAKSIADEHNIFRTRIGKYRALYRIDHQKSKIIIFKIDRRENIYD